MVRNARRYPRPDAEEAKGPCANLIAVRTADKDKPWVAKLVKALPSREVRQFVETTLKGTLIPAF